MKKTISITKFVEDSIKMMRFFGDLLKDYEFSFELKKKGQPATEAEIDQISKRIADKVSKYSVFPTKKA